MDVDHPPPSQRTHGVIITSLLRQNDVAASFWRNNDVTITPCASLIAGIVHWVHGSIPDHCPRLTARTLYSLLAIWRCRRSFIQWEHIFDWMLSCHWPKWLQIIAWIQDPDCHMLRGNPGSRFNIKIASPGSDLWWILILVRRHYGYCDGWRITQQVCRPTYLREPR